MSGEMEAAGGMATAGLVAAAIEGPNPGKVGEGACLNCGAHLNGGRFCANCGQAAHANRSLWALLEELLWNVFNLDTKAWRTVPRLVFRPGTLTRAYIDGKRARYLTPLATFLLCYFLMFLVFSTLPKPSTLNLSDAGSAEHVTDARDNLNDANGDLQEAQRGLAEARRDAGPNASGPEQLAIAAAERAVTLTQQRVQRQQAALERAEQRQRAQQSSPVQVHVNGDPETAAQSSTAATPTTTVTMPAPTPPPVPAGHQGAAPPVSPAPGVDLTDDNGPITLDDVLKKVARENVTVDGHPWLNAQMRANLANPPLFYARLQEAGARWGFLLVPLSLPFIAFLFFFKKNITLYDHTVFALNSLSFASLLFALIFSSFMVSWLKWAPAASLLVVLPAHTFFHVGGAYKLKWWSAFWRTWFLLIFSTIVLSFFLVAVLFIGLAG